MIPDKIYVREYQDGIAHFWESKKKEDVVATISHEYIRKDALMEFLDFMKDYHSGVYISADVLNAIERLKEKINSL